VLALGTAACWHTVPMYRYSVPVASSLLLATVCFNMFIVHQYMQCIACTDEQ